MQNKRRTLGIITCNFSTKNKKPSFVEERFFKDLTSLGKKHNIEIFIFHPNKVFFAKNKALGFKFVNGSWKESLEKLPNFIYDRCHYKSLNHFQKYHKNILKIRSHPFIKFLSKPLNGKLKTTEILKLNNKLQNFLIPTLEYKNTAEVLNFLKKNNNKIILKPNNLSHGRGIIYVENSKDNTFILNIRTKENLKASLTFNNKESFFKWLLSFIKNTKYIMQPYLELHTRNNKEPFDVRVLLQKTSKENWQLTGKAIRLGQKDSITSNLHGGGKALNFENFLKENFTAQEINTIAEKINTLITNVPKHLEQNHGQLCELGIDIGIDTKANVFLLEINSKPGRSIFLELDDYKTYLKSVKCPLLYLKSLL